MSIADKITRLQAAKTGIASAITTKGGTVASGDGFEDFAADIASIPAGGGGGIDNIDVYIVDYFTDTVTLTKGCIIPSERAIYT